MKTKQKQWGKALAVFVLFGVALFAAPASYAALTDGLVAYYCFDDATNIGKDCSGNGNNGAAEGVVTTTTGLIGGAASFNGYNSPADIHVPNSSSLQFTNDVTISFAVNMAVLDGNVNSIVAKSHDRTGFALYVLNDANNYLYSATASFEWDGNNNFVNEGKKSQIGQWKIVTYVFSSQSHSAKVFINGVFIKTVDIPNLSFNTSNTQDLYLGKFSDSIYPLNGSLDEVRIYNRALSATEVTALYNLSNPIQGTAPWKTLHTVTCQNITQNKTVVIPKTKVNAWDCEKAGLPVNHGDKVKVTIDGTKF